MTSIEDIEKALVNRGFKQNGNEFSYELVTYNNMNINGKEVRQENKNILTLIYSGVGGEMNDSDICNDDMFFFDIIDNGTPTDSIGVTSAEELLSLFRL